MECPELGGEGDANVEEVIEGVIYPLPKLSRPSEEGGSDEASRATLLTRLSISPALSSVLSFSSWMSLRDNCILFYSYFLLAALAQPTSL